MNNEDYKPIINEFFDFLDSKEDDNREFSDFLRNNNSVLTSHPAYIYNKERENLGYMHYKLEKYFYKREPEKDTDKIFIEKMDFIKNNYQELFYELEMHTDLLRAENYTSMIDYLDDRKVKLFTQQKKLEEKQNSLSDSINEQKKIIGKQKKIIEDQQHSFQKTTGKINSIYSEFITILGIFTAITFAIFGGMNLLTNLFKNTGSTASSLGYTLIIAAIFGLIMWGITELLFYWISKIKGITDSTKDKNKILFNWIAIIVLTGILILGVLLFTKKIK